MICEVGTGVMSSLMLGIPIASIEYFLLLSTELTGTRYSFLLMISFCLSTFSVVIPLSPSSSAVSERIRLI